MLTLPYAMKWTQFYANTSFANIYYGKIQDM